MKGSLRKEVWEESGWGELLHGAVQCLESKVVPEQVWMDQGRNVTTLFVKNSVALFTGINMCFFISVLDAFARHFDVLTFFF